MALLWQSGLQSMKRIISFFKCLDLKMPQIALAAGLGSLSRLHCPKIERLFLNPLFSQHMDANALKAP